MLRYVWLDSTTDFNNLALAYFNNAKLFKAFTVNTVPFGVVEKNNVFERRLLYSQMLHLLDFKQIWKKI